MYRESSPLVVVNPAHLHATSQTQSVNKSFICYSDRATMTICTSESQATERVVSSQVSYSNTCAPANKILERYFRLSYIYNVRPCQFTLSNHNNSCYLQDSKVRDPTHG